MTSASDRYQEKSDKKEHTMRNSSTPPLLRLEDICVKFGFVEALKSVNLSIQRQEVIAIVGDNGAGKSTLIKVIAGFLQPGLGHIYLNGEQVTIPSIREADRMGIASVFQGQEFCDNLDVASNLFLGKEINQIGIRDDDSMNSRARSVLKTLSSAIRVGSPIASLSVGQRQTVAIARTLLNDCLLYTSRSKARRRGPDAVQGSPEWLCGRCERCFWSPAGLRRRADGRAWTRSQWTVLSPLRVRPVSWRRTCGCWPASWRGLPREARSANRKALLP